jgi:predicted 2-oxoglutarate/Fe(II)-dependent dioxygenase YbiX/peroxiredoxin
MGSDRLLHDFVAMQNQFESSRIPFFGVTVDPEDVQLEHLITRPTYFKLLWDFEQRVSQLFGICESSEKSKREPLSLETYGPTSFVLNERMQVVGIFPMKDPETHAQQVFEFASQLSVSGPAEFAIPQAPVLSIPHVLSPDLCQRLIHLYETNGGRDSGFMRQIDGKTVEVLDYSFKQRRDFLLEDPNLLQTINDLILRRVKPEIEKAFQFSISRFERHLVACYESTTQGFFRRHRDNTTKGTAHRRFAMTLNLNTGQYDGGCLWFPEFGSRLYRPGIGEAIVFSCSLLHEVTPVTQGRRFAMLSFFYGEEDAKVRDRNRKHVVLREDSFRETDTQTSDRPSVTKSSLGFQSQSQRASGKSKKSTKQKTRSK